MTPSPEDRVSDPDGSRSLSGDEIVVSGISGIFPNSDNVTQFVDNLYNKVDMISRNDMFEGVKHPEMPQHIGKINGKEKFDAQFFRVTHWQASTLDLLSRKLMEHTFGALFDAGINPASFNGSTLGVFMATFSEDIIAQMYNSYKTNSFVMSGCSKAMVANRISYWIDAKRPSYAVDASNAGSMTCLELAYKSMKSGECDAAIVGAGNTFSFPKTFLNMKRAGHLCLDGKTKCFDKNGDGFVRSEAVNVIVLQKAKYAKRIYAEVLNVKGKFFASPDDLFLPLRNSKDQQQFLKEFYSEVNVSPDEVEYVEACGLGIAEADGNELEAVGEIFGGKQPVMIGSVNSNMGNSEVASGICGLTKVCLAYQKGKLPANLHYYEPQNHISAVRSGRVQVLTENTPFNRGYAALNNLSYTGCNHHMLIKGHYKRKEQNRYKSTIPYIVLVSGRHDKSVNRIIDYLTNNPVDPEQIALLHKIYQHNVSGHTGRGYVILENKFGETNTLSKNFNYYSGENRPIWFLYSGMGSQWTGMGAELMHLPIFAAAIERCRKILEPKGVDIVKIVTGQDRSTFDYILNSFVGIAAVQIGLTDILKALGIVPDYIIGHSVGEVGCAYADGSFTAEEMILSAYYRGLASVQAKLIRGSMAAIGLGYKDILPLCPPEIQVACHNSSQSSTISGPGDIMQQFVADLASRGIFAKEVPCANIAFHTKHIAPAGPVLLSYMKNVIKDPKQRSEKWLCTSVPKDEWDSAKYASAEYFTNNLLNPVYFEETARMIPRDAIVIEIAPHGLLQAIVKRSHKDCIHVPLTQRGHKDPVNFLLEALGDLYQVGLNLKVQSLYPEVQFPVSTETPNLSELVEWDHSEDWYHHIYTIPIKETMAARDLLMNVHDDEYKYFMNRIVNGKVMLPEAALLVLTWETLASYEGVHYENQSVVFENIKFYKEVIMPERQLKLNILIQKGSQRFEITNEESLIVSGFIYTVTDTGYRGELLISDDDLKLTTSDVYKILRLRGYSYENKFQSIHSTNVARSKAQIKWTGEWVTFLDSLIQFNVLARDHDGVSSPTFINSLTIDIKTHSNMANKIVNNDVICYNAEICDKMYEVTKCGGVKIQAISFKDKPKTETDHVLLKRTFVPYFPTEKMNMYTTLEVNLLIVAENVIEKDIMATELLTEKDCAVFQLLKKIANETNSYNFKINSVNLGNNWPREILQQSNLLVVHNLLQYKNLQKVLSEGIANGTVRPITRVTYMPEEVSRAFRLLSNSGHRGRVLINMTDITSSSKIKVKPRISLSPTAAYVIVCDERGLALEMIDFLLTRGAKNIVLQANCIALERYIQLRLAIWRKTDVIIDTSSDSLVEVEACRKFIKTATALGPVEGIFIIEKNETTNQNMEKQKEFESSQAQLIAKNLDFVSRQCCPALSYFVIISPSVRKFGDVLSNGIFERICEERDDVGLPGLLLHTDVSNQLDLNTNYDQVIQLPAVTASILCALERSLRLNYTNAVVNLKKKHNTSQFLTRIAKYLGVTNVDDILEDNKIINDFNIDENAIKGISTAIEESYKISFSNEELLQMTIASLKSFEIKGNELNRKFNNGLGAFFNYIDEDQYLATEPIITMKTQLSNVEERDEELDPKTMYLMMIPGFEGHHKIFTNLSERLKIRAVTIQLDIDSKDDSIQKMARSALEHIKIRFQLGSKFYLMGYSFGVNVALELATLLEKEGRVGIVYCLDASPDALRVHLKSYMGDLDDEKLQNTILEYTFGLTSGKQSQTLKENLEKVRTWSEKVNIFVLALKGIVAHSHQYLRSIVEAVYKRIMLAKEYDPCFNLKSELVLMKSVPHPKAETLTDDYGLSKYSNKPVRVFNIEADHAQAPNDCRVANIVNRLLDPQILEDFKRYDCCDFYYK